MTNERLLTAGLVVVGLVLLAVAVVYFAEPAGSLPSFFPGHEAGSSHHHVKHGIAAAVLGIGAFVLVWFRTGPRTQDARPAAT